MRRAALSLVLVSLLAALAGGIVHVVAYDESGELTFQPRVDTNALSWWRTRASRTLDALPELELRLADEHR